MNALLFALLLMQDKAIVEGTILNAVTDEPVRKAGVTLNAKKSYSVLSSNDGKFRFEGVDPSEYQLRVHRQGFLDADDEPSIKVSSGQQVKDLVVKLTPQGIIAGRVVDEDGDPVEDAEVNLERSLPVNGRKVSLSSDSDRTNSEGYFFIGGLKAGLYRISATPQSNRGPLPSGPREDF